MSENLEAWIMKQSKDTLQNVLAELINRLIDTEEISELEDGRPVWSASGIGIDEIE